MKFLAEHGKHNTHILLHRTAEKIEYGEEGSDDDCNISQISHFNSLFNSKSQQSSIQNANNATLVDKSRKTLNRKYSMDAVIS